MSVSIQIPIRTHDNFGDSISKLIKTISKITSIQDDEIILDFRHAKMLNPFFYVVWYVLFKDYSHQEQSLFSITVRIPKLIHI